MRNDLKELVLSIGGYRYVVFAIDEWIGSFLGRSRYSKGGVRRARRPEGRHLVKRPR